MIDPQVTEMETPDLQELRKLPPFTGVSDEHLAEIFPRLAWRDLSEGAVLLRPGAVNTNLFIIVSGRMRLTAPPWIASSRS